MKRHPLLFLLVIVPVLAGLVAGEAAAAPGDLDQTFRRGGLVETRLGSSSGQVPLDSLRQPDGKILLVGRTKSAGYGVVARYLPDGKLDPDFGEKGFVEVEGVVFESVALDASGRVVIAGHTGDRGVVTRLMADGTLDNGFADQGFFRSRFNPSQDDTEGHRPESPRLPGLAVLPDGTIYAAGKGQGCDYDCEYMLLLRLDGDGEPLTVAGQSGTWSRTLQSLSAIDILPDGRLVVANRDSYSDGYDSWDSSAVALYAAPDADGAVKRIWSKGTPDRAPRPGGGGTVTATEDGGFFLASGSVVYKATATGPDLTFGNRGVAGFERRTFRGGAGSLDIRADQVVEDPHGNLAVAGLGTDGGFSSVFLVRLTPDGLPDATFDNDGFAIHWSWTGRDSSGLIRPRVMAVGENYRLTGAAGEYGALKFGIAGVRGGTAPSATCDGRPATWLGNNRRQSINVKSGVIVTRGGNDVIHVEGDDESTVVCAGSGNDRIYLNGGTGFGEGGNDRIEGSKRKDRRTKKEATTEETIHGGPGADYLTGFGGDDRIFGNEGPDTILGGTGEDDLFGGAGADEITGQEGNDHLIGGPGRDYLEGGPTIRPRSYYSGKLGKTEAELIRVGRTFIRIRIKTPTSCGPYDSYRYWYTIGKPVRIGKNGKLNFADERTYDAQRLEARLTGKSIRGRYMYSSSDDYDICWTGKGMFRPWVRFEADFDRTRRQVVRQ